MNLYKFLASFMLFAVMALSPAMAYFDGYGIEGVTVNTTSYHFDEDGREHNSNNYGLGLIAGKRQSSVSFEFDVFRNSRPETSYTVAAFVNRTLGSINAFGFGDIDYGGSLGVASYLKSSRHERVEIPVVRAYGDIPFIDKSKIRLGVHPKFFSLQFVFDTN